MAEVTETQTQTEEVSTVAESAVEDVSTSAQEVAESVDTEANTATVSFSKEDLDWGELELDDSARDNLYNEYAPLFKDKDSANAYLKKVAEVAKQQKADAEAKAEAEKELKKNKVAELEASWEKSLKTDANFGKDYDGNKKKVLDLVSKYTSEEELAEFKKFGFDKSPVLNRLLLKVNAQFEDAKVMKGQTAPDNPKQQPTNMFGETMFDFSKKQ